MNVKRLSLASLFLVMACVCSFANTFVKVTKKSQLVPGNRYLLICEGTSGKYVAFSVRGKHGITCAKESEGHFTVQKSNEGSHTMLLISSDINSENKPVAYTLGTGTNENEYTLYDTSCNKYIGLDGNVRYTDDKEIWKIVETNLTFSDNLNNEGNLFLPSNANGNEYINYRGKNNAGQPQFTSSPEEFPVALYVETTGGDIGQTKITFGRSSEGGDYYATVYYGNNDFIMDKDMTAWGLNSSLTSVIPAGETSTIELKDLKPENEVIYAGTPVILKINSGLVESTSEFIEYPIHLLVKAHQDLATTDTYLKGTDVEITSAPENTYKMTRKSGVLGFYKADGTTINAHRAYIEVPASTVKQFTFSLNGETAIKEISTPQEQEINNDDATYNLLTGQKVNKNHKGLVVKKGKKFINK